MLSIPEERRASPWRKKRERLMLTTVIGWLIVGGLCGWFASLIVRNSTQGGILINVLVGIVGAIVAGAVFGKGNIAYGFSIEAFLWAVVGAVVLLVAANLIFGSKLR
jgi:uncharacterized membrane protein YeaQ/YmgE (transglycosylase-associated protein family)